MTNKYDEQKPRDKDDDDCGRFQGCCSNIRDPYVIPALIGLLIVYWFLKSLWRDFKRLFSKNIYELFTTPELYMMLITAAVVSFLVLNPVGWGVIGLSLSAVAYSLLYMCVSYSIKEQERRAKVCESSTPGIVLKIL